MQEIIGNIEYKDWLYSLKVKIRNSQIKAALSVNTELIQLYWDLGRQINEKQENARWGSKFIDELSRDLKSEFPEMTGFSRSNLFAMKRFYQFHQQHDTIIQQAAGLIQKTKIQQDAGQIANQNILNLVDKIPWSHNILIIEKTRNHAEALFYVNETIINNWSRSVLEYQIETKLFDRQGKSVNNFAVTMPQHHSDLANQLLKDPYCFEFLNLDKKASETDLEKQLVANITQFLLELGKGFAYMGRQFAIKVGNREYRTDLLFYHIKLRCYIIIELKMKEFEPEFIGKLNFYMNSINQLIKTHDDNTTIGMILCKGKDNIVVEFALKDVNNPIGVSEFKYKDLPEFYRNELPDIELLKNELNKYASNE